MAGLLLSLIESPFWDLPEAHTASNLEYPGMEGYQPSNQKSPCHDDRSYKADYLQARTDKIIITIDKIVDKEKRISYT